ncbi:hypothetical protein D3C73_1478580 [compost metagenome]
MREEDRGGGKPAFFRVKMVLRDPGAVKAVFFGMYDLFRRQPITFAGRNIVE